VLPALEDSPQIGRPRARSRGIPGPRSRLPRKMLATLHRRGAANGLGDPGTADNRTSIARALHSPARHLSTRGARMCRNWNRCHGPGHLYETIGSADPRTQARPSHARFAGLRRSTGPGFPDRSQTNRRNPACASPAAWLKFTSPVGPGFGPRRQFPEGPAGYGSAGTDRCSGQPRFRSDRPTRSAKQSRNNNDRVPRCLRQAQGGQGVRA
jgi:hypothetical protein